MDIEKIKESLNKYIQELGFHLFDVIFYKKDNTLSILLDDKLSMDELEEISNKLSDYMDQFENDIEGTYILDISTVGVERPIRNEDELIKAVGEYIYVKYKDDEVYGTLLKYEDGILSIEYKEKTRDKIKNIEYSKVKKVRYAVKF